MERAIYDHDLAQAWADVIILLAMHSTVLQNSNSNSNSIG